MASECNACGGSGRNSEHSECACFTCGGVGKNFTAVAGVPMEYLQQTRVDSRFWCDACQFLYHADRCMFHGRRHATPP